MSYNNQKHIFHTIINVDLMVRNVVKAKNGTKINVNANITNQWNNIDVIKVVDSSICVFKCDSYTKNVAYNLKISWKQINNATTINTYSGQNLNYLLFFLLLLPIITMYMNVIIIKLMFVKL